MHFQVDIALVKTLRNIDLAGGKYQAKKYVTPYIFVFRKWKFEVYRTVLAYYKYLWLIKR